MRCKERNYPPFAKLPRRTYDLLKQLMCHIEDTTRQTMKIEEKEPTHAAPYICQPGCFALLTKKGINALLQKNGMFHPIEHGTFLESLQIQCVTYHVLDERAYREGLQIWTI